MIVLVFVLTFAVSFGVMRFAKHRFVPIVVFVAVLWVMYGPWHVAHLL
jgi:hypothetical protein